MTRTGIDAGRVWQVDSVAAERGHDAVERSNSDGATSSAYSGRRWSEFLSLLTRDFWTDFPLI